MSEGQKECKITSAWLVLYLYVFLNFVMLHRTVLQAKKTWIYIFTWGTTLKSYLVVCDSVYVEKYELLPAVQDQRVLLFFPTSFNSFLFDIRWLAVKLPSRRQLLHPPELGMDRTDLIGQPGPSSHSKAKTPKRFDNWLLGTTEQQPT